MYSSFRPPRAGDPWRLLDHVLIDAGGVFELVLLEHPALEVQVIQSPLLSEIIDQLDRLIEFALLGRRLDVDFVT